MIAYNPKQAMIKNVSANLYCLDNMKKPPLMTQIPTIELQKIMQWGLDAHKSLHNIENELNQLCAAISKAKGK